MSIHIGEKIKEVLKVSDMSVTEFAQKISYSRRNVYSILSKKSIDTELLERVSKVLEYNFFQGYLPSKKEYGVKSDQTGVADKDAPYLKKRVEELVKEVEYLKEINKLLKDKLKKSK